MYTSLCSPCAVHPRGGIFLRQGRGASCGKSAALRWLNRVLSWGTSVVLQWTTVVYLTCRTDKLEALGEALAIVDFARAETRKRAPHLTHPLLCLDAIRTGIQSGGRAGLRAVRVLSSGHKGLGVVATLCSVSVSDCCSAFLEAISTGWCADGPCTNCLRNQISIQQLTDAEHAMLLALVMHAYERPASVPVSSDPACCASSGVRGWTSCFHCSV